MFVCDITTCILGTRCMQSTNIYKVRPDFATAYLSAGSLAVETTAAIGQLCACIFFPAAHVALFKKLFCYKNTPKNMQMWISEAGMHTGCLTTAATDTQGHPVLRTTGHADLVTHVNRLLQRLQRAPPCISDRHSTYSL